MTAAEEVERVERHLAWALEFLRELDRAEREGRCTLDVSTRVGLRAVLGREEPRPRFGYCLDCRHLHVDLRAGQGEGVPPCQAPGCTCFHEKPGGTMG